jgi:hypothetical protein
MALSTILDVQELYREVRDAFHTALGLCQDVLEKRGWEEHIWRLGPSEQWGRGQKTSQAGLSVPALGNAIDDP